MQSTVERERRQECFGSFSEDNEFQTTRGDPMNLTDDREQDASRPKRSVLGDVRRITQMRVADGRDIVEIELTDGTETILAFDTVS